MPQIVQVQPDGLAWALERTTLNGVGIQTGHAIWTIQPPKGAYIISCRVGAGPVAGVIAAVSLRLSYDSRLPASMGAPEDVEVAYQGAATGEQSITVTGIPVEFDGVTPLRIRFDASTVSVSINAAVQGALVLHPVASTPVRVSHVATATVP